MFLFPVFVYSLLLFKLVCRVLQSYKKNQKIKSKMDRAHPTHRPPNFFFVNSSLTWTEHSNHNDYNNF